MPPMTIDGNKRKSNIGFAAKKSGVYLIAVNGDVRYIGFSESDLQKTCLRHFQEWNDASQTRVTYRSLTGITVRIVLTTPGRAAAIERGLIIKMKPADNPNKLQSYLGFVPKEDKVFLDELDKLFISPIKDLDDYVPF